MKKKTSWSEYVLYSAILGILMQIVMNKNGDNYSSYTSDSSTNNYSWAGQDSVRYHRNQIIADSIKRISNCYEQPALQSDPWLLRLFARLIKINEANICDSAMPVSPIKCNYFVVLPGYRLQTGTEFYIDNGHYFFQTIDAAMDNESGKRAGFTSKKADVRFSKLYAKDIDLATQPGYLLIPIKEKNFRTARIFVYVIVVILALYASWVLIVLPVRILYSIVKRKVFSTENVRYCAIIGWSLIAFAVLPIVAGVLFYFIFSHTQPDEVSFFVKDIADEINGILLAGLLVLVLRRILQNGYHFQLHRELTI